MPRLRLIDFRVSDGPPVIGLCKENLPGCANAANRAQRRLIFAKEAGDEGWWGSFAEVAFNGVSQLTPYLTLQREIARVEAFNVCDQPIQSNNQYYEYLQFGNGRMPKRCRNHDRWGCMTESFARNNAVTFVDQTIFPCILRVFATSSNDINSTKRILLQGLDHVGNVIYSSNGGHQVQGIFLDFDSPFSDAPIQFSRITGIQKDVTEGPVQIFQVDPTTGAMTLLLTMEPSETVAGYRRYYLHDLPRNCCRLTNTQTPLLPVRVTAIVKLELIPAVNDLDYLLIQNLEALIEECISIRMSAMDNANAQQIAMVHHLNAIRLLNSEITHFLGKQSPAVGFHPFGSAKLERQAIGRMI